MRRTFACAALVASLAITLGCSQNSQERAREKAAQARDETRAEARKLGVEAKEDARKLRQNIDHAVNGAAPGASGYEASEKLHAGAHDLHVAGDRAAVKLSHAALIAKVKAKLAADVGLSTVKDVDVDASGHVVTLRGSVDSEAQREQAAEAVSRLEGVTKVVNDLKVRP